MKRARDGRIAVPVPALAWEMMQILVTEAARGGHQIVPDDMARLSYDLVFAHVREGNRERVQIAAPDQAPPPRSPFDPMR